MLHGAFTLEDYHFLSHLTYYVFQTRLPNYVFHICTFVKIPMIDYIFRALLSKIKRKENTFLVRMVIMRHFKSNFLLKKRPFQ